MTYTRRGKCEICKASARETRDFAVTTDMFNPHAEPKITKEVFKEMQDWRAEPMYCREHTK